MASLLTWITVVLGIVTFIRLLAYQRRGARFRCDVNIMAIMACITAAVEIRIGTFVVLVTAWLMIVMHTVLAIGLFKIRGNPAPVFGGS
ncbi:phage holin family protein [Azomonas macrocytogenes]|uniref:Ca2+/Na+ antiporter n=1 Tax=Azomonas macrocytogenes TaxID=69962 RepID=A0A839T674_AZOMA|nr:phage holin family protein [Azomonas macrocytogenes]MBB3103966.1 Ca2+/Na+ antiporter [Azomonas macrocytogenes]